MTVHCNNCNIEVDSERIHCPICGKCVNAENVDKALKREKYPDYLSWKKEQFSITALLTLILFILNLTWLVTEYAVFGNFYYTCIFVATSILAFFILIWPLTRRQHILEKGVIAIFSLSAFLVFIEFYTDTFGWGLSYAIPAVLLAYDIAAFVVMFTRGYYKRSVLYPCFFIALCSSVVFALNFTVFKNSVSVFWPCIVVFALSWIMFATLFIIRRRKIINGLKKDFYM